MAEISGPRTTLPEPVPARDRDAHLATMRAWHADRFPAQGENEGRLSCATSAPPIIATSSTGRIVLLDPETGEVIER